MCSSKYPHDGVKLAPETLRTVLDTPIPAKMRDKAYFSGTKLSDLDESAWEKLSRKTCLKLGEVIVIRVSKVVAGTQYPNKRELLELPIPPIPSTISLDDLALETRTFNCLKASGLLKKMVKSGRITVGDLLDIPAFGARCLVDLLASIETHNKYAAMSHLKNGAYGSPSTSDLKDETSDLPNRRIRIKIQRYPRNDHLLLPDILYEGLKDRVSSSERRLLSHVRSLGIKVWREKDKTQCIKLSKQIVSIINNKGLYQLPYGILNHCLYRNVLRHDIQLPLENRTASRLFRAKLTSDVKIFSRTRVKDLLQLPGFGAKSLLDILVSLDSVELIYKDSPPPPGSSGRTTSKTDISLENVKRNRVNTVVLPFPRPGYPLVPSILLDAVLSAMPSSMLSRATKFLPLGARIWESFSANKCVEVFDSLVAGNAKNFSQLLTPDLLQCRLVGLGLSQVDPLIVTRRTYNCLAGANLLNNYPKLAKTKIGDLIKLQNFGTISLLDLLSALECPAGPVDALSLNARTKIHCIEDEIVSLLQLEPNLKKRQILLLRYGLEGSSPRTLEAVGKIVGLTRERIRQYCAGYQKALHELRPATPWLDKAVALIETHQPCSEAELRMQMRKQGLVKGRMTIDRLESVLKLLGRSIPFTFYTHNGKRLVLPKGFKHGQ